MGAYFLLSLVRAALELDRNSCAGLDSMKYLYPAADELSKLDDERLALKIARHSACSLCDPSCNGFHPSDDAQVLLDEDAEEEEDSQPVYLDECGCGHGVKEHGADLDSLSRNEFERRGRASVRLDQLLQVPNVPWLEFINLTSWPQV